LLRPRDLPQPAHGGRRVASGVVGAGDAGPASLDLPLLQYEPPAGDLDQRVAGTPDEYCRLEATATDVNRRDAARNAGGTLWSVQAAFEARVAAHPLGAPRGGDSAVAAADAQADGLLQQARTELLTALDRLPLAT